MECSYRHFKAGVKKNLQPLCGGILTVLPSSYSRPPRERKIPVPDQITKNTEISPSRLTLLGFGLFVRPGWALYSFTFLFFASHDRR